MHPNLIKLLINNRGKGLFKAEKAVKSQEATIYLYDVIVSDDYFGGISALAFAKEVSNIDAQVIHLRINSPGGDVFAARTMQQAMRDHGAAFIAHVDGVAASAATFLVASADESVISEGGMFMIHNAWTLAMGNANELRKTAQLLEKIDGSIVNDYAKLTGQSPEQIKAWMDAETYFIGQEAIDNGFIQSLSTETVKNRIQWDLSAYEHAPEQPPIESPAENLLEELPKNRPKFQTYLAA